jgi:hypothetical protein
MSEMSVLDKNGDTKHIWDPKNEDETASAKLIFDTLKKKGHVAYSVDDDGDKTEIITKFDPKLGRMILAPPMVGG